MLPHFIFLLLEPNRAVALTHARINRRQVSSNRHRKTALSASGALILSSSVYALEKNAVSESITPNPAYIKKNSTINLIFTRSVAHATRIVRTPNTSINGDSSSYTRKYMYEMKLTAPNFEFISIALCPVIL